LKGVVTTTGAFVPVLWSFRRTRNVVLVALVRGEWFFTESISSVSSFLPFLVLFPLVGGSFFLPIYPYIFLHFFIPEDQRGSTTYMLIHNLVEFLRRGNTLNPKRCFFRHIFEGVNRIAELRLK
jgi:glycerol-3-phosphate acyltransferase PlsY